MLVWCRQLALGLILAGVLFAPILYDMAREWVVLEEMGHGLFVPFVAAYIIWRDRQRLAETPIRPSYMGLLVVILGCTQMLVGSLAAEYFISRSAFLVTAVGVVWTLCGKELVRRLLFPLIILAFMIRWPTILYNQITFPLQLIASQTAEWSLTAVGIPVLREGNVLELPSQKLSVVEACSGIRSLLSLSFLSIMYGYLFDLRMWIRVVLLVATIPIAILGNAFRVTLTGILSEYKPEWTEGFFHSLEGWIIFLVALVCLVFLHQALERGVHLMKGHRA